MIVTIKKKNEKEITSWAWRYKTITSVVFIYLFLQLYYLIDCTINIMEIGLLF